MSGSVVYFPTKKTTTTTLTGSGNYTVPDGVTRLDVTLYGAGGGGGVFGSGSGSLNGYALGGSAGSRSVFTMNVSPGQVIAYACGVLGAPGAAPLNAGNNGTSTTFGATNQAPGGKGGIAGQISSLEIRLPNGANGYVQGAIGGTSSNGTTSYGGGDAGVGNGGQVSVNNTTRNGGIAAGGGAGPNATFGTGGSGIIYVTYTNPVS